MIFQQNFVNDFSKKNFCLDNIEKFSAFKDNINMFMKVLLIFIGGGIGAALRYFISDWSKRVFTIPVIGTFIVNIIGCFLIGFILGLTVNKSLEISGNLKLLIIVGLLGGLTTFSTFSLEVFEFLNAGKIASGLLYTGLSVILGLFFTYLGVILSNLCIK